MIQTSEVTVWKHRMGRRRAQRNASNANTDSGVAIDSNASNGSRKELFKELWEAAVTLRGSIEPAGRSSTSMWFLAGAHVRSSIKGTTPAAFEVSGEVAGIPVGSCPSAKGKKCLFRTGCAREREVAVSCLGCNTLPVKG